MGSLAQTVLPIVGGAIGTFIAPGIGTALGAEAGSLAGNAIHGGGGGGMGGILGGGKGGSSGGGTGAQNAYAGNITGLADQVAGLAPNALNVGLNMGAYASPLMNMGLNQYAAGALNALTPSQQALTDYTRGQMNLGTNQAYGNLGLGGSTMQAQDLNANALQSLAQQEQIGFQNQQAGLAGMGTANQLFGTDLAGIMDAGGLLGNAGNLYATAGGDVLTQNQMLQQGLGLAGQGLGGLANMIGGGSTSSGGGKTGGLLSNMFGGGVGAGGGKAAGAGSDVASTTMLDAAGNVLPNVGKAAMSVA